MSREASDRFRRLKAWLSMRGLSQRELAETLGVHPSMITRIFKGERTPADRIEQLVRLGIPSQLLPSPNTRGPGRPRKERLEEH